MLSCFDSPTTESYFLEGSDISPFDERGLARLRREKIGLIFQQFHLFPYLTTLENVMVSQFLHSQIDRQDTETAFSKLDLHIDLIICLRSFQEAKNKEYVLLKKNQLVFSGITT